MSGGGIPIPIGGRKPVNIFGGIPGGGPDGGIIIGGIPDNIRCCAKSGGWPGGGIAIIPGRAV